MILAGVTAHQAHLVAVHALERHELRREFIAMHRFLGAVANRARQQAVSPTHPTGGAGVGALKQEVIPRSLLMWQQVV